MTLDMMTVVDYIWNEDGLSTVKIQLPCAVDDILYESWFMIRIQ